MTREDAVKSETQIQFAKSEIERLKDIFDITPSFLLYEIFGISIWANVKNSSRRISIIEKNKRFKKSINLRHDEYGMFLKVCNYISSLREEISSLRNQRREKNTQSLLNKTWDKTEKCMRKLNRFLFSRSGFRIERHMGGAYALDNGRYYDPVDLFLPLFWYKTVFEAGISVIRGTKGILIVAQAEKLILNNIPEIDYDLPECTIFKVNTVGIRNRKPINESGYLLVDNYEDLEKPFPETSNAYNHCIYNYYIKCDNKIHAFSTDLKKAAILLNRRVKQEILKNV
jgi:hypothetical protein